MFGYYYWIWCVIYPIPRCALWMDDYNSAAEAAVSL